MHIFFTILSWIIFWGGTFFAVWFSNFRGPWAFFIPVFIAIILAIPIHAIGKLIADQKETKSILKEMQSSQDKLSQELNDLKRLLAQSTADVWQLISGGGGGGVNYGGAILGGLLFGDAGAIIGSNVGTEAAPISSHTKEIDTRLLCLVIADSKGNEYTIAFTNSATSAFEWFIPEKEYSYVISKRRQMFESEDTE